MTNNIYIIRDHAIGDVIWVDPVIRYFLKKGKKVCFVGIRSFVFKSHQEQNLTVKKRLNVFEYLLFFIDKYIYKTGMFIDLNGTYEAKPKQHVLISYFEKANVDNYELTYPKIHYRTQDQIVNKIASKYVVIHLDPDRYKNYRNVYGVSWDVIVSHLKKMGFLVVCISKKEENRFGHWIKTDNYDSLATLISNASMFIGVDSAPSHIAASLGIPSLIFFGSVNPKFRHLPSFRGYFLQQACEYAGCFHETLELGGQSCRLVGDEGIPKCCFHTDQYVKNNIDNLILKYL